MIDKQVPELRRELADALCAVQAFPVPRSGLHQMLASLLLTAFVGLDDASAVDRVQAVAIALHALREWRRYATIGTEFPLSASAP